MFCNSNDFSIIAKLNQRIHLLIVDNNLMEEKLRKCEQHLIQTAEEHGVTWLDSMLTYCK